MSLLLRLSFFALIALLPLHPQTFRIHSVLGDAQHRDGIPATAARFSSINGLAVDASGQLYIADSTAHRVLRVNRDGSISTVAGTGSAGYSGDGGPATLATLNSPYGLAVDAAGSVFIADFGNARIRRVDPNGTIRSVSPTTRFIGPRNVATASSGDLYVSDYADHRVYRIPPNGAATVIAGAGSSLSLSAPAGIAADGLGAVYIADSGNRRVLRVAAGTATTILEAQSAQIALGAPLALSIDAFGTLLIADTQNRVLQRSPTGLVTVLPAADLGIATIGELALSPRGIAYIADGKQVLRLSAGSAPELVAGGGAEDPGRLDGPIGLAFNNTGDLFVAEEAARRIRKLTPSGEIVTAAAGSLLTDPVAIAIHPGFGVRIADYQSNRILALAASGDLYTVSGDGQPGFTGDGEYATSARWNKPRSLVFDSAGNLFIADSLNHRVRRIGLDGRVSTVAGIGVPGFASSGGLAIRSPLNTPTALAIGPHDTLYIADAANHTVLAVSPSGTLTRIAGTGSSGDSGDGGLATQAQLRFPAGLAVSSEGTLFIADTYNHRIRRVLTTGVIDTIAGDGQPGLDGDGGHAIAARLHTPTALAFHPDGALYLADLDNNRVRRISPTAEFPPAPAPTPIVDPAPATTAAELFLRNAASLASGPISPGEILIVEASPSAELRIDGRTAARVAAASISAIAVQVPYSVSPGSTVPVELWEAGRLVARRSVPVAASSPGIYNSKGAAVLIHADGSRNSPENPAPRGSVVSIFLTGAGLLSPLPADGIPARDPLPEPVSPIAVRVGRSDADIIWTGAAPALIGIVQINFRLPGLFTPPGTRSLRVAIGGIESPDNIVVYLK